MKTKQAFISASILEKTKTKIQILTYDRRSGHKSSATAVDFSLWSNTVSVRVRLAAQYLPWLWESIQWIKSNRLLLLFSIWPFFVCLFRCFQRRDVADLVQIWILVYILDLCGSCRALAAPYLQWRWESIQWIKSNQLRFTKNFRALVLPQCSSGVLRAWVNRE